MDIGAVRFVMRMHQERERRWVQEGSSFLGCQSRLLAGGRLLFRFDRVSTSWDENSLGSLDDLSH
jgi:hypothetical protein